MLHLHSFHGQGELISHTHVSNSHLLHLSSLRAGTASLQRSEHPSRLTDLPIVVQLHIFSYLDVSSLCCLAQTCSGLNQTSSDPLLWSALLVRDSHKWTVISHLSYPLHYHTAHCDLTPKQIYQACYSRRECHLERWFTHPLTAKLRVLVRRLQGHIPRLLVFGSGLETLPFIRNLMWEEQSPYKPIGMFPGKDGIGSGVCVEHKSQPVNLITLYRAPKAERVSRSVNKLLKQEELTAGVQDQCQQADGLILVIDSMSIDSTVENCGMLRAMLAHCRSQTPLLVLSCSEAALACAERLELEQFNNPWQVRMLLLGNYSGLVQGVDWLIRAT